MKPLVLASRSPARGRLLAAAGISFSVEPADLDERAEEDAVSEAGLDPAGVALHLARRKAETVAARRPDDVVVGADQTLEVEGERLTRPQSLDEARAQLVRLRGRTHRLHSAVACIAGGESWWTASSAELTMRDFSDAFLEEYLARCGERTLESVGAYHLEGHGIQLFRAIEGDFFTILGLPMIPLLEHLRAVEVLQR